MLVRLLEFGETLPKYGQVATGSHGVGVSNPKDAPHPLHRLIEEFLGKYQIVSRGSSTLQDRIRVTVSKPEAYIVVGAEHASSQGKQWARERHRLTGVACFDEYN